MERQAINAREIQTWTLLKCAKCAGRSGQALSSCSCMNSLLITVDVRCPDCQHEWQLARDSVEALPPLIPVVPRLHVRQ